MTPQELKSSILQLAIQGRLVEQRPEEGTGEELYQQIQAEKRRLIKAGKIKRGESLPEITEDEIPFDIPENWKWVRLGQIGCTNIGLTYKPQNISGSGTIVLRSNNIQDGKMTYEDIVRVLMDIPDNKMCNKGDILICARNGSKRLVGKAAIIDQDGMSFGAFMAIFRSVCNEYILYVINSIFFRNSLLEDTGTTTINQITQDLLINAIIPLPPLAEQKRIVARIEELLPYIDRYEQAWSKLEEFNKRFPDDMQKSLLQYAIQGKLVQQCPEEGTGDDLYQQIQTEKRRLIKAGKIKREKPLPEITEDDIPFDIPENWKWVRLPEIGELNRGKSKHRPRNAPELYANGTTPMIQTGDVARANKYITEWSTMYNDIGVAQSRIWSAGTLCMTIAANIGDVAILSFDACFPDSVVGFNAYNPILTNEFFMYGLMCYKTILDEMSRSTAQKNINLDIISKVAFPLPPLAEQKRIVAKLEEILPLCEKLKK